GIIVDTGVAEDNSLEIGDEVTVTGSAGTPMTLTIQAISDDLTFIGYWAVDIDTYTELEVNPQLIMVMADVADGDDVEATRANITESLEVHPGVEVLDRDEWIGDLSSQITGILSFVTALLAMSVIIAA